MKQAFGSGLNLAAILFYLYAAIVQWNDADGLIWILVYGATAFLIAARSRLRIHPSIYLGLFILFIVWSLFVGGDSLQSDGIIRIEERREAGGLLLVALTMFGLFLVTRKKDPATLKESEGDDNYERNS